MLADVRRFFLIFLAFILPLQAIAAAERSFAHAMQETSNKAEFIKHFVDHAEHVLHHHDDDGSEHDDESQASVQHLTDHEQSCSMNVMVSAPVLTVFFAASPPRPGFHLDVIPIRSISPPLRPPHVPA